MSAIAKDASITLITAVPGSGKTLRAVWYMREAVAAGEKVFATNVNGLKVDGVTEFPDPTKWEDLETGSILIVDECQKFFRAGRNVPDYIAAMETIRHMGIRLILLTQHPGLIHANIRALVGRHEHLVRENGKESSLVFTRSRLIANVSSDKSLAAEDHHTWAFPKDCYDLYTSAEVHTVKRTVPYKYKRALIFAAIAAALLFFVVRTVRQAMGKDVPVLAPSGAVTTPSALRPERKPEISTAAQYAEQMQPLIADAPFTAPGFVNRSFASDPQVFCMSTGTMRGKVWTADTCSCLTEQGTRYELQFDMCAQLSRHGGRYNPYKPKDLAADAVRQGEDRTDEPPAGEGVPEGQAVASTSTPFGAFPEYGGMGVGASPR